MVGRMVRFSEVGTSSINLLKDFCTVLHKYPQGFGEKPLAKFSECS
jgi:hypothetical protein